MNKRKLSLRARDFHNKESAITKEGEEEKLTHRETHARELFSVREFNVMTMMTTMTTTRENFLGKALKMEGLVTAVHL